MIATQRSSTRTSVWLAIAIFAFGVLLYAYAFAQTFHIDDFIQLRWLDHKSLLDIWTANDRGYYRPTSFMLWKLVHIAFGSYQPVVLHALNIISHALCGVLVFALFMRALPDPDAELRRWVSALAALLFLAFPFSYQVVPWIGALNHPLATLFILSALLMAFAAREGHTIARSALALAFTAAAIVSHEAGVIIGPLLLLILAVQTPAPSFRSLLRRTWPYFALGIALPVLIAALRQEPPAFNAMTMESRFQNSAYFLQGLVYAIAPLAAPVMRLLNISDMAAVLLVCVPALLLLAGGLFLIGKGRIALLAIGWYAIAIAPALLLLPFSYVIDGPRLMYQASIGAALLAAAQLAWLRVPGRRALLPKTIFGIVVPAGALIFSLAFLSERAGLYEQTRRLANGLLSEMGPSADNAKMAIAVNFPSWIAPKQNSYAIGHEGVTFVPGYSSLIDLYYLHTGREKPVASVVLPHLQVDGRYSFANHGQAFDPYDIQPSLRQGDRILFVSTKGDDAFISDAGNLEATQASDAQSSDALATYGQTLRLLSQAHQRIDPQRLRVELRWLLLEKPAEELRTFVHVLSPAGELVAQEDGLPLMNMADPRAWEKGDIWRDVRMITLPPNLPPGRYALRVGVYRAADGTRLPAIDSTGKPILDNSASVGEWVVP